MLLTVITVKVTKYKSRPFEHAVSMSKWPSRSLYIGNIIHYLIYLPIPFPKVLEIYLEGSSIFPIPIPSIHIDRLSLFCYL